MFVLTADQLYQGLVIPSSFLGLFPFPLDPGVETLLIAEGSA